MRIQKLKLKRRLRRKHSVRKQIYGTQERPRLTLTRSGIHIYAQLINDDEGVTLVSASTLDKELKGRISTGMKKIEKSKLVGSELAKRALEANIKKVVFDRNGYLYHGRIKALADAARETGLEF